METVTEQIYELPEDLLFTFVFGIVLMAPRKEECD